MFLKPKRVRKDGKTHTYWALVESVRTPKGPRHRTVAYLGELKASERTGWIQLAGSQARRIEPTSPLFPSAEVQDEEVPATVEVEVRGVRIDRTREFGNVFLALSLWKLLELDVLFSRLLPVGREEVPWAVVGAILTCARFCWPSSELHVAETWYEATALDELLGVAPEQVGKDRLYRAHDRILPLKDEIERHLKERFTTLFDAKYDLLLYDVTSTYFEGDAPFNPQAKRGYSRDHRPDCKQVCIGLIVTRDGLPVAYEVFDGNRNDATTVEEIVQSIESKHGQVNRIWVMDRGMINEENLEFIRSRGGHYIVGTPKPMLRQYEAQLAEEADWSAVHEGLDVKLCEAPGGIETFVLCRSEDRRQKEKAMHERFEIRIEQSLQSLARRLEKARTLPDRAQVERQIGRILQRNSRASKLFEISVNDVVREGEPGLQVTWQKREGWRAWSSLSEGCYLLRTNLKDWPADELWRHYIQLTQVEAAFRTEKEQLNLRPIWHWDEHRVQAHILFSFLAYVLWKTLEQWMVRSGLGNAPRTVLEELGRIKLNDVLLPTKSGRTVHLRCVTLPDDRQRILLSRLSLEVPQRLGQPRWSDDVVPNSASPTAVTTPPGAI